MNYEEYKSQKEKHLFEIEKLSDYYINLHKEYNRGEILLINGIKSIVRYNKIEYNGKVTPICYRLKKDGTQSEIRSYIYNDSKIERFSLAKG